MEPEDSYLTIAAPAEASSRERSSKFLAYAYPVQQEEQIREILDGLRKKYYDATHHCYAWRLGPGGAAFRANDDGEPSGTAGKPARIVERTVDRTIRVDFPYIAMNDIMRVIKEQQPKIASQEFDNLCTMVLTIRESRAGELTEKLKKAGGSIAGEDI